MPDQRKLQRRGEAVPLVSPSTRTKEKTERTLSGWLSTISSQERSTHLRPRAMASSIPSLHWEEELDSSIGHTERVLKSTTNEITFRINLGIEDEERAPWDDTKIPVNFAGLSDGVVAICDFEFHDFWKKVSVLILESVIPSERGHLPIARDWS